MQELITTEDLSQDCRRVNKEAKRYGYHLTECNYDSLSEKFFYRICNNNLKHSTSVDYKQPVIDVIKAEMPLISVGPSGIGGEYQTEISSNQSNILSKIIKRLFNRN